MIDKTVSHYRIVGKLGEGGMGEVYRATDTKLHRDVALKILPRLFASDPQRLGRFSREAQVLASLNHPNIASIHGLEDSDGVQALVMELVEGEDLSARISRGPIPLKEALEIALQVAEALEAAHDRGIIHRDLKPANIKVTPDGLVKVLDFGLAKALEGSPTSSPDMTQSPTLSLAATQAGIILGTAGYMSPEQARGQAVDRRADVWAFGVILYEMVTGRQAFRGDTLSDTLAKVLERNPDWKALPSDIPDSIRRVIERCVEKNVRRRIQAIGDARIAIEEYLENPEAGTSPLPVREEARAGRLSWKFWAGAALSLLLAAAAGWFLRPAPPAPPPLHLEAVVGGDQSLFVEQGSALALSSDGTRLAYVTGSSGGIGRRLHVRTLSRLEDEEFPGTDQAYNPFFSPDGNWVGFVTPTELKKVSVSGGTPLSLCTVNLSRGATWGENGIIVLASSPNSGLVKVSAAGGATEELTQLQDGEVSQRWPQFLPGGRKILFTSYKSSDRNAGRVEVLDLDSGTRKVIHEGGSYARYMASGHLLFLNNGTLFAAPFDPDGLEMKALPAPVLQGINVSDEGGAQLDVSDEGTLVYLTGQVQGARRSLVAADPEGDIKEVSKTRRDYVHPRLSPDGRRLALEALSDGNRDIWVHDLERDTQTRLTFDESADSYPVWSPDGQFVYFGSIRDGKFGIFRKRADGSGQVERLTESNNPQTPYSASPDGKYLTVDEQNLTSASFDIRVLDLAEPSKPVEFLMTPFSEADAVFSPDSRWIAYESDESGQWEIYVRPFPGPGGKWQVSTDGGEYTRWARDGSRLFFMKANSLWAVSTTIRGESIEIGRPEVMFEVRGSLQPDYDASPDGSRFFLVLDEQSVDRRGPNLVKFTFHWFEELNRLLQMSQ